uniref:Uncharacterized protein n=1 Tax=Opuntia streptacantha TaxID=393608 RepID=A0A7C9D882_OPUST
MRKKQELFFTQLSQLNHIQMLPKLSIASKNAVFDGGDYYVVVAATHSWKAMIGIAGEREKGPLARERERLQLQSSIFNLQFICCTFWVSLRQLDGEKERKPNALGENA